MNYNNRTKIDFCVHKKQKYSLGNKTFYKNEFVHYIIQERDWENILSRSKTRYNKNNIGPLQLRSILLLLTQGKTIEQASNFVGIQSRSIKKRFKDIELEFKYGYSKYQKSCQFCFLKLKGKLIRVISVDKFIELLDNRHLSKTTPYNEKIKHRWKEIKEFYLQRNSYYIKNRHYLDPNQKAVKESVQNILNQYSTTNNSNNKYKQTRKISVSSFYRFISIMGIKDIPIDILPYKSIGKGKNLKVVKHDTKKKSIGKIITLRPESINKRLNDNDYEMDTVVGKTTDKYVILTLLNRKTRMFYFTFTKRNATSVKENLYKIIIENNLKIDTLTIDNGSENYKIDELKEVGEIYHCHPYSSSEKGSIENCHRLLRRFIPKGKSIDKYLEYDTKNIFNFINSYARKIGGDSSITSAFIIHNQSQNINLLLEK